MAALGTSATLPAKAEEQGRTFEIYGFTMLDWIQDSKRVDPNWMDAFRPSKIATPEGEFGTNGQSDLSVKQSSFGVKGAMPTGESTAPVGFKFGFDMFGLGANAGKTTIHLQDAYGEWGQLLAGQTTSLFMDIDIFPTSIDYWGPCGMVFLRNPQIRWTVIRTAEHSLAIAFERPSNDVDPGNIRLIGEFANATVRGDQTIPDFTAQFRTDQSWGHVQVATILRRVGYEYQTTPDGAFTEGHQRGWGIDLTGGLTTLGKDQLLLGVVYGAGIASYMNDGGMDLAPMASPSPTSPLPALAARAVPLRGITAYYDHYWSDRWSSSIGYSFTEVSNTNFQAPDAFHKGQYASANLLMYPVANVMMGVELLWGKRTDNDGTTGDDVRYQFSVKYNFSVEL